MISLAICLASPNARDELGLLSDLIAQRFASLPVVFSRASWEAAAKQSELLNPDCIGGAMLAADQIKETHRGISASKSSAPASCIGSAFRGISGHRFR